MFSYHCLVITPIGHQAGGLTRELTKSVFILYSGVGKWLV